MANWQPQLENEEIKLIPLAEHHHEDLFDVASDPEIWVQHPNSDRYQKDVFAEFFKTALKSGSAFAIYNKAEKRLVGSTRFYDYDEQSGSIAIGYTFLSTASWGRKINHSVKSLMLEYAFHHVNTVIFHIGVNNFRSQIATGRLGAKKSGTQAENFVFRFCLWKTIH